MRNLIHQTNTVKRFVNNGPENKFVYYGTVVSTDDDTEGGKIRVKIIGLDDKLNDVNVPEATPLIPNYFNYIPQRGEGAYVIISDPTKKNSDRLYIGGVISQLSSINYDDSISALSTTDKGKTKPPPAPSTYPESKGVYPSKYDISMLGRNNNDIILEKETSSIKIRVGKHEVGNPLKLNRTNPAYIKLTFETKSDGDGYYSNNIIVADKIALISHKDSDISVTRVEPDKEQRNAIFEKGHPMVRGDKLVEALNLMRDAIAQHIHNGAKNPALVYGAISKLNELNFEAMLQKNIIIN